MTPIDLGGAAKKAADTVAPGAADAGYAPAATEPEQAAVAGLLGAGGTQLSGLLEKFGSAGLGEQVQSWIGKGSNLPVSAEQIKSVLESDQLASLASKLGVSPDQAAEKVAGLLPGVIDKVTPDGIVPDPEELAGKLTGLLKQRSGA